MRCNTNSEMARVFFSVNYKGKILLYFAFDTGKALPLCFCLFSCSEREHPFPSFLLELLDERILEAFMVAVRSC